MKSMILLLCIFVTGSSYAQTFIGKNPEKVMKMLNKYDAGSGFEKPVITRQDSSITMMVKGTGSIQTTFVYRFSRSSGKCISEQVKASCDSCYKKYLDDLLAQKKYHWKKINENQYVSSYSHRRLIELPVDPADFSYLILETGWTKKMYNLLMNKE